jgi:hypothetical protein
MIGERTLNLRDLLRPDQPGGAALPTGGTLLRLLIPIVVFGMVYGAVMGAFGGLSPDRWLQLLFSALKVPMLLLVTFAICLPSFFVLNTLLGVRDDFGNVVRALVGTQIVLAIVLASLAPYTALWYLSFDHYNNAILFNGVMFAVASVTAQFALRRMYRPLIASNPRHRWLFRIWLLLYIFVGIQMAWVLRPYIGDPTLPTEFFREDSWSNAYEAVARKLWGALSG